MKASAGNKQLAVRIEDEMLVAIDRRRLEVAQELGTIPTRSDIVRIALEEYLAGKPEKIRANK